ncbi:hypothetical protein BDZ89DRAFT_1074951, partial [Hymenopellis radicata]
MDLRYPTKFHALLASDGDADLTAFGIMDTSGCVGDVTWTSSCRSEQRRYRRCCKIPTAVITSSSVQELDAQFSFTSRPL